MLKSAPNMQKILGARESLGKETPLMAAARTGQIEIVRLILDSSFCRTTVLAELDIYENNALMLAAHNGHAEIANLILSKAKLLSPDLVLPLNLLKKQNKSGKNALMLAARYGQPQIVETILAFYQANNLQKQLQEVLQAKDFYGDNALGLALASDNSKLVKLLAPHYKLSNDHSILRQAIINDDLEIVEIILALENFNRELLSARSSDGMTAFGLAVAGGNTKIIAKLIEHIAGDRAKQLLIYKVCTYDSNTQSKIPFSIQPNESLFDEQIGFSALALALFLDKAEVFAAIMDSPQFTHQNFIWSFFCAAELGKIDIIKKILRQNKFDYRDLILDKDNNPLCLAAKNGHIDVFQALLDSDKCPANIFRYPWSNTHIGYDPLVLAAKNGHIAIVKAILNSNKCPAYAYAYAAKQNGLNFNKAIHYAAKNGHTNIVQAILDSDNCPNDALYSYEGTLQGAVENGDVELVEVILNSDKFKAISLSDQRRSLRYAAENGNIEIFSKILNSDKLSADILNSEASYDKNWPSDWEGTPLSLAAKHGKLEIVQAILNSNRYSVDTSLKWGYLVPLRLAAKNGHADVVRAILNSDKFPVNVLDIHPFYDHNVYELVDLPLSLAAQKGHIEVLKAFLESDKIPADILNLHLNIGLRSAAKHGKLEIVQAILNSNKCPDNIFQERKHVSCDSAIRYAAIGGHTQIVQAILNSDKCPADILVQKDYLGWTPLSNAAACGHTELIKLIVNSDKFHPSLFKTKQGERYPNCTLLEVAHNEEVKKILIRFEKQFHHQNKFFQLADNAGGQEKIDAVIKFLEDYSGSTKNFLRLHWNRHHTKRAKQLILELRNIRTGNKLDAAKKAVNASLDAAKLTTGFNNNGSFSRRLDLCLKNLSPAPFEF